MNARLLTFAPILLVFGLFISRTEVYGQCTPQLNVNPTACAGAPLAVSFIGFTGSCSGTGSYRLQMTRFKVGNSFSFNPTLPDTLALDDPFTPPNQVYDLDIDLPDGNYGLRLVYTQGGNTFNSPTYPIEIRSTDTSTIPSISAKIDSSFLGPPYCPSDTIRLVAFNGNNLGSDPTFQWRLNGTVVPDNRVIGDIENDSLTVTGIFSEQDTFDVIVRPSIPCLKKRSDTSKPILIPLIPDPDPDVTIEVDSGSGCQDSVSVLYAKASSSTGVTMNYQWSIDGTDIPAPRGVDSLLRLQASEAKLTNTIKVVVTHPLCPKDYRSQAIWQVETCRYIRVFDTLPDVYCAGDSIYFPYIVNAPFTPGNSFTAQISNDTANPSSWVDIGTKADTLGGVFAGQLPRTLTTATDYSIRMISSNPAETSQTTWDNITVNGLPAPPTVSNDSTCENGTVTLSASGGTLYNWYDAQTGGNLLGTGSTLDTFLVAPANISVFVAIEDPVTGCESDRVRVRGVASPLPVMDAGASPDTICIDKPDYFLNGYSPTFNGSGQWKVLPPSPATGVSSGGEVRPSILGVGQHTLRYTFTTNFGCVDSADKVLEILPLPTPDAGNDTLVCLNSGLFNLGGAPAGGTWSGPTGLLVNGSGDVNPVVLGSFDFIYTLNSASCIARDTMQVTVQDGPAFNVNTIPSTICDSCLGLASVSGSGINTSTHAIEWYAGTTLLGDSSLSIGVGQPIDTGLCADASKLGGAYSVTVTNLSTGCSRTRNFTISDPSGPAIDFSPNIDGNTYCLNADSIILTADSTQRITWSSNVTPISANQAILYIDSLGSGGNPATGTFTVSVSYKGSDSCTNSESKTFDVISSPVITMNSTDTAVCLDAAFFNLSASSTSTGSWLPIMNGGNTVLNSLGEFRPIFAVSETVYNCQYVADNGSCTDTASVAITILPSPNGALSPGGLVCSGECYPVKIIGLDSVASAYTFQWLNGPNVIPGAITDSICPDSSGVYSVEVNFNGSTCINLISSTTVTEVSTPTVNAGPDTTICEGSNPCLAGLPVNGTWSDANGYIDPAGCFNTSLSGTGSFTVTYSYTNSNGCSASDTRVVNVDSKFNFSVNVTDATTCSSCDGIATISPTPPPGYSITWSIVGFADTATATGLCTGNYSVTVTTPGGCPSTESFTVNPGGPPAGVSVLAALDSVCQDGPLVQFVKSGPGGAPTWSPTSYMDSTGQFDPAAAFALGGEGWYPVFASIQVNPTCTATAEDSIYVSAKPIINPMGNVVVCLSDPVFQLSPGQTGNCYWEATPFLDAAGNVDPSAVLSTGSYTVKYICTNGPCTTEETRTLIFQGVPDFSFVTDTPSVCGSSDGQLTVDLPGGAAYTYSWNTGGSNRILSNISAGNYTVTVTDIASGCQRTKSIFLPDPGTSMNLTPITAICADSGPVTVNATPAIDSLNINGTLVLGNTFDPSNAGLINYAPLSNSLIAYGSTGGCLAADSTIFTIYPDPVISLTLPQDTICEGATVSIGQTISPAGLTGSGNWVNQTTADTFATNVFDPALHGQVGLNEIEYIFTSTNGGCQSSATVFIEVAPQPQVVLTALPTDSCGSSTGRAALDITSGTLTQHTINWSSNVGSVNAAGDTAFGLSAMGTYSVQIINNATGCDTTITFGVNDPSGPTVNITNPVGSFICANADTAFFSSNPPSSNWTINGNPSPDYIIPSLYSGNVTIGATVTDPLTGCTGSTTKTFSIRNVSVNAGNNQTVCRDPSGQVVLNPSIPGGSWTAPNGGTIVGSNFVPDQVGTFKLVYQVPTNGCTATDSLFITVDSLPTFQPVVVQQPNPCGNNNGRITISNFPSNLYIRWNQGSLNGPVPPGGTTPTPFNLVAGTYFATIIDTAGTGCSQTVSVVLSDGPAPPLSPPSNLPTSICRGDAPVTLAVGTDTIVRINGQQTRTLNPGQIPSDTAEVVQEFFNSVTNCTSVRLDKVPILPQNPPGLVQRSITLCASSADIDLNQYTTDSSGSWEAPLGRASCLKFGSVIEPNCLAGGSFTFKYCYEDGPDRCEACDSLIVNVSTPPATFNPGPVLNVCINDPCIDLTQGVSPSTGFSIEQDHPGISGFEFCAQNPGVTPTAPNQPIILTYNWNINGCTGTAQRAVNVYDAPLAPADTVVCTDADIFAVTAFPDGGEWTSDCSGIVNSNGLITPPDSAQTCRLVYQVPGAPCSDEMTIEFKEAPSVESISPSESISIQRGNEQQVDIQTNLPNAQFNWSPGIGVSDATIPNPVLSPDSNTTYTVTITTADTLCQEVVEISVFVNVALDLTIADAISPNGDNVHDRWEIINMANHPDADVKVFNRWGGTVYEAKGADFADRNKLFDGTHINGEELPVGTYYYVIDNLRGDRAAKTGSLTIIR